MCGWKTGNKTPRMRVSGIASDGLKQVFVGGCGHLMQTSLR